MHKSFCSTTELLKNHLIAPFKNKTLTIQISHNQGTSFNNEFSTPITILQTTRINTVHIFTNTQAQTYPLILKQVHCCRYYRPWKHEHWLELRVDLACQMEFSMVAWVVLACAASNSASVEKNWPAVLPHAPKCLHHYWITLLEQMGPLHACFLFSVCLDAAPATTPALDKLLDLSRNIKWFM